MARRSGPRASAPDVDPAASPDADPESIARSIALGRLSVAPQTRAQLDAAMAKKGVPVEVRDEVLNRFGDVGLIDDAAFAQLWVESRHAGRGLGKRALGHELRTRGVAPQVADEAVGALTAEQEEETARQLVARRLPGMRRLDSATRTRRLAGMLARKGYPAGLSMRVVREALAADADQLAGDHLAGGHLAGDADHLVGDRLTGGDRLPDEFEDPLYRGDVWEDD